VAQLAIQVQQHDVLHVHGGNCRHETRQLPDSHQWSDPSLSLLVTRLTARVSAAGTGPSAIHIANDKTLVVTRLLFFYPTGPAAMFRASVQADKIFTSDYMFHPMAAVEHAQVQHSHSADDSAPAAHRPKRRRRR
jgi:hypothetical protein